MKQNFTIKLHYIFYLIHHVGHLLQTDQYVPDAWNEMESNMP